MDSALLPCCDCSVQASGCPPTPLPLSAPPPPEWVTPVSPPGPNSVACLRNATERDAGLFCLGHVASLRPLSLASPGCWDPSLFSGYLFALS